MKKFGITFAALLITIAITILFSAIGILPHYLMPIIISWQALVVLAGLKTILLRIYLPGIFILSVGGYFLVPKIYSVIGTEFPFDNITWNAIAIALALVLLAISSFYVSLWMPNIKGFKGIEPDKKGITQINYAFGAFEHTIIEQPYNSVKTALAFGEFTLDLTKTTLKDGDSYLEINNAFGSTMLIVPSHWNIILSVHSFFGSVRDNRTNKPTIAGNNQMVIKGVNAFGEVSIISKQMDFAEDDETEKLENISVKHNNRIFIISLDQLLYIQAEGDYVTLCTTEGNFLKEQTMKYFQNVLPCERFVRIHRSYIVNLAEINSVDNRGREVYYVTLKNGMTLRTSAAGYQDLKQRLEL